MTDVHCYAENVPNTGSNVFTISSIVYATLHVPAGSVESYRTTSPWSSFGRIKPNNTYDLTYIVDGEVYKLYEVEYNTPIVPEEDPSKEGYTFSGWNDLPETMPAHDVVVTGIFIINSYTLTYKVDDEIYKTYEV